MNTGKLIVLCMNRIRVKLKNNGGFGMNELLGIAAALIVAAFIIIPQLRTFATTVMSALNTWWTGTIVSQIFETS